MVEQWSPKPKVKGSTPFSPVQASTNPNPSLREMVTKDKKDKFLWLYL